MALVSVIIPVYNASQFIKESVDSILNQTFTDFELIIVDDHSNDNSATIIKQLNDKRIRFFQLPANMGVANALNFGLGLANGKYILRMDADDISESLRLEKQVRYMEEHPEIGVSGTLAEYFDGTLINSSVPNSYLKPQLLNYCPFVHPTIIIRKSILDNYRLKYMGLLEDYYMWVKLSPFTSFGNVNEVLLKYRVNIFQVSSTQNKLRILESISLRCEFAEMWLRRPLSNLDKAFISNLDKQLSKNSLSHLFKLCEEFIKKDPWNNLEAVKYVIKKFFVNNFYCYGKLYFSSLLLINCNFLSYKEKISLIKKSFV